MKWFHNFAQREDVKAVLDVLEKRKDLPMPEKMAVKMDNENGKTWTGLFMWNILTIVQDYPGFFVMFATFSIVGIFAIILQLVLHAVYGPHVFHQFW